MNFGMVYVVALHELRASVMRRSFVLLTLGMPLLFAGYLGLVTGIGALAAADEAARGSSAAPVGVVDTGGLLGDDPGWRRFADREAAEEAVRSGELSAFVLLPPDYVRQGRYTLYVRRYRLLSSGPSRRIEARLRERLLLKAGVSPELIERTRRSAEVSQLELDDSGQFVPVDPVAKAAALSIPASTAFGLILALAMNASLLLASVVEDKENKMMDVLLSSVRADELLFGKVLGIVAAGLLQLFVWGSMLVATLAALAALRPESALFADVSLGGIALAGGFGVLSFLFYGVMLVGLGSFGSSFRDSQQLAAIVIMMPMIPFVASPLFLSDANGPVPRLLSYLPPTTAPAMMLRVALGEVPIWEIALALVLLLVSIAAAVRASAKLFRVGTLLYGKRASLGLLWRALTEPM